MMNTAREQYLKSRLQEHYEFLLSKGYDVVCIMLQGSQNYGLDEYSDDYYSDVDTKAIVLPHLNDFINAATPISKVEVLPNDEHAEVKDIRVMFEMFKKANISYIELLYTEYKIINDAWASSIEPLFSNRDLVSSCNRIQFLKCIAGMAMEKDKALCHPYPATAAKIEKWGYDGKQLSHCVRLYNFIWRYVSGEPLESCYRVQEPIHTVLMNLKKQKDADGNTLDVESAKEMSKYYVAEIRKIKDAAAVEGENLDAFQFLRELQTKIIREKMIRDLKVGENDDGV